MKTTVIKLGGAESEDKEFLKNFSQELAQFKDTGVILVHGGGSSITKLQSEAGIPHKTIDGLRVTDSQTLELVKLVLWRKINSAIVAALRLGGLAVEGMAGFEGGLIKAKKLVLEDGQDLGFVGEVTGVNTLPIQSQLKLEKIVVIAPLGVDEEGQAYNVNADSAAVGVALALKSQSIRFVTNVLGVLKQGKKMDRLNVAEAEALIADGTITGGMIPKVRAALSAVAAGIPEVWITKDGREGTVFS
ncbi:MAG: acetylglutamate kinase [Xanthomonadaceae bacterium]|nr:acetylglutamate kinase [Xanthomonadaceae bacterium]